MSTIWQLCEAIVDNGVRNTNFFNGRLLSAEDLQVEQQARRQLQAMLGEAIGAGVVRGLEASVDNFQTDKINSTLLVRAGLAINASGQVLSLPQDVQVSVTAPTTPTLRQGGAFGQCADSINALPSSIGIYLLALSPAAQTRGSAPFSGLGQGGAITGCGDRYEMEGVQFRLIKVNLDETLGLVKAEADRLKELVAAANLPWSQGAAAGDPANLSLLRNLTAYHFFGSEALTALAADPFRLVSGQSAYQQYGLLDRLRTGARPLLGSADVPLALLFWSVRGIRFVDNWAVRRMPAAPFDASPWSAFLGQRRVREAEAMSMQFSQHLLALLRGQEGFNRISGANLLAKDYFEWLPPAGILPLTSSFGTSAFAEGANPNVFFYGQQVRNPDQDPVFIEGAVVPGLLQEAMAYPPIHVGGQELIWLYRVRENQQAASAGRTQTYLIFTNGHVPYRGDARYQLGYYDFGNHA